MRKKIKEQNSKLVIFLISFVVLCIIIASRSLIRNSWSQEAEVKEETVSEEKKEALREGKKGKRQGIDQEKLKSMLTSAGPLTPETKELYKSSLPRRVEFIKNNIYKNDRSISPILEHLNLMLTSEEMLSVAPDIVEVLLDVIERHRIAIVRMTALSQIRSLGDKSAIPRLNVALYNEEDMQTKVGIAGTLVALGEKEVPFFVLANVVRWRDVEGWKIDGTGRWSGYPEGSPKREKIIKEVKQRIIPNNALRILAEIGTGEAESVIREAINDRNPYVRFAAARIMMEKFAEKYLSFQVIADIAQDTNIENLTRATAIKLLGKMGETYILESLLNDENKYIRQNAKEALKKIK